MNSIRNEKIKKRMHFLINNQPHDHEWDSALEEIEYFMWSTIFDDVYVEETDSLETNPLSLIEDESLEILLDILKNHYLGKKISKQNLSDFEKGLFALIVEEVKQYQSEDYDYHVTDYMISEVFGVAMKGFVKKNGLVRKYQNDSYDETDSSGCQYWNLLGENSVSEDYPEKDNDGFVVVKYLTDNGWEDEFANWNGSEFSVPNVDAWRFICSKDIDLYVDVKRKQHELKNNLTEVPMFLKAAYVFNPEIAILEFMKLKKYAEN